VSETTRLLYHLALAPEWERARHAGSYDRSTIDRSLAEEGFIHCSFAEQVQATADRFYRGRDDVVLLRIDPHRLDAPIREEVAPGTGQAFPHVYGPIDVVAVVAADPVPVGADGRLDVGGLLPP
jgi:uncharacterized protein (DUF952 family)